MKTVLVVEDAQTERQLIAALLGHAGFSVSTAEDVEQAWQWLEKNDVPNLVVLDIIMPGESGLDLCRRMREQDRFSKVPVLFCSSKSEEYDRFWALRQGGSGYITKPFAPTDLLKSVYEFVD
jgi:twitching motility two-component system response regulator PilH